MTPDQIALRDRVLKGKTPADYLEHQARNNPRSPLYVPKRTNAHPERDLQNAILQWLALRNVCHVRMDVKPPTYFAGGKLIRTPSPLKGWPDILCIVPMNGVGAAIGLEVKAGTRQSPEQREVERYMKEVGGAAYHVVKSVEDVIQIIEPLL